MTISKNQIKSQQSTQSFDSGRNRVAVQNMIKEQLCFGKNCSYCQQHKNSCQG